MSAFHTLAIQSVTKETPECVVIEFDMPEHLYDEFQFRQGQHLTLKADIDGQDVRRSYSLCSSPDELVWRVAVKQIPGGIFSTYANRHLKPGDTLEVMPPSGAFNVPVSKTKANYIAFAAGSGITPIMSMIKTHLKQEPDATFKLFYVNKTAQSIIFKEELEQLKNRYFNRFHAFYFLTQEQRDIPFLNGRFDSEKIDLLTQRFIDVEDTAHCFICGPKDMIFLIRDKLMDAGLDAQQIHYELFYSGDEDKSVTPEVLDHRMEGTQVTIIDGGKEFHFTHANGGQSILDSALEAGADLPYACKGGVCSTCKCQLIDGQIEMKVNYALEEDELARNMILSCQAIPLSEKVTVDFDV